MAIPQIITDGAYVTLYWNLSGVLGLNVLGARVLPSTLVNQALATALGAAIKSTFSSTLAIHISPSVQLVRVGVRDMRVEHQPEYRDPGGAVPGTGLGDMMPASVAQNLTLRTLGAGKSFRGRVYLSGWVEDDNNSDGTQSSTAGAAGVAFLAAVKTNFTSNGLALAVCSRPSEKIEYHRITFHADGTQDDKLMSTVRAKTSTVNDVIAVESRTTAWEQQRRRTNGRGIAPALLSPVAQQVF